MRGGVWCWRRVGGDERNRGKMGEEILEGEGRLRGGETNRMRGEPKKCYHETKPEKYLLQ